MPQYEVRFMFQNRSLSEFVGANSAGDAIHVVKARYPGALIFVANRV